MSVYRATVSFAQQVAIDRHLNPFVPGGNWDPYNRAAGTDGSGSTATLLEACTYGAGMPWLREGSTERYRPPSLGGIANPANGPFATLMVDSPSDFPPDAAVLIAVHHDSAGGVTSHMWCQVGQLKIETHGPDGTYPNGATVLNDGVNFTDVVLEMNDPSANCWWYLPGPIMEDGTPIPTAPSPVVKSPGGD